MGLRSVAGRFGFVSRASALSFATVLVLLGTQPATAMPLIAESITDTGAPSPPSLPVESQSFRVLDPSLSAEPQLEVSGTLEVLAVEGEDGGSIEYRLLTSSGEFAVSGDLEGVTSGSSFEGTVAVPEILLERAALRNSAFESGSESFRQATSALQPEELINLAQNESATLPIASGTIKSAAINLGSAAHNVDVVVLNGAAFTDSQVNNLVSGLNNFWSSQSNGAITSVTRANSVKRYSSSYLSSCNYYSMWNEAAAKFHPGQSRNWYLNNSGQHLLVLYTPGKDCGTGIAVVGGGTNGSGYLFADVSGPTQLHTVAHEFGHNLGLGHANTHVCSGASRSEGSSAQGCQDREYRDYYDLMSGAFNYGSANTNKLTALSVTDRVLLDIVPAGFLQTITAGSPQTINLSPVSATSGVRGIQVQDPNSGGIYYVEFRSGTGMDTGAFYTKAFPYSSNPNDYKYDLGRLQTGLRVMKLRGASPGSSSVAFTFPKQSSEPAKMLALKSGSNSAFFSQNYGLEIQFLGMSGSDAIVQISGLAKPPTDRIYGSDRFETSTVLSQNAFPSGADIVYVAQGANYPDALAAAPAAALEAGPLLLTSSNVLSSNVKAEIERLRPSKIVVVGGTGVISPAVFESLQNLSKGEWSPAETIRLGGSDRYETARLVVREAFLDRPSAPGGSNIAYVATGTGFPDALSGSAAAGSVGAPIILVNGSASAVDPATAQLIADLGVSELRIVGGTGVVSSAMASSLASITGVTVVRFGGADRFETNTLVNAGIFTGGFPKAYLATGMQFPDALSGAAVAGAQGLPLFLSQTKCLPLSAYRAVMDGGPGLVTLIGGPGVLTAAVSDLLVC